MGEINASNQLVKGKQPVSDQMYCFENSMKYCQYCRVYGSHGRSSCDQSTPSVAIVTYN